MQKPDIFRKLPQTALSRRAVEQKCKSPTSSGNCLKPLYQEEQWSKNAKARHQKLCVKHGFYAEIGLKQKGYIGLNSI